MTCSSIESLAAMYPSYVLATTPKPRPSDKILCGCCNRNGVPGRITHHTLGLLCHWCSLTFDPRLDSRPRQQGLRYQASDSCAACIEQSDLCELHER